MKSCLTNQFLLIVETLTHQLIQVHPSVTVRCVKILKIGNNAKDNKNNSLSQIKTYGNRYKQMGCRYF